MILRRYWFLLLILALQQLLHHGVQVTYSLSLAITHPYRRPVYSDLTNDKLSMPPHSTDLRIIQEKMQHDVQHGPYRLG
jgi:hypothetical protein